MAFTLLALHGIMRIKVRRKIKPLALFSALFLSLAPGLWPEEAAKQFVLDNGFRVFLLEKRNLPLVNVVVAVDLGVKDETAETSGLVHVLEHCILFRGTEVRSGTAVSRDIRRHGAYFNAHTGEDLSYFEISTPAEALDFALTNQREILFDLKITPEELDSEKEIILEEFRQLQDDPFRYATTLAYQRLFQGHPYANPPAGTVEVIQNLTAESLLGFHERYFVPENCALAAVGDFSLPEMEEKVRRVFGGIVVVGGEKKKIDPVRPLEEGAEVDIAMDVNKAYLVIAALAPDYNHADQYAIEVLTEIIGRGVNPMLYSALMNPRRLIQTISMAYHSHRHGGAVLVFLTLDRKNLAAAKREALDFLRKVRDQNFSPQDVYGEQQMFAFDFLESAKNQIKYNAHLAQEKGLALAVSMARFMLLSEGSARRNYLQSIDQVKSGDLRKAAAKYLSRSPYVLIAITPKTVD